ncbi:MAG: dynamin family protein, partial [Oscillospiraceae bacterium]|nr:dynamin family protein [Oscillospiraceae bacterium]
MGFKEVQAKANEIRQAVLESSALVGARDGSKVVGVDVPVGLGLTTYAKSLTAEAERLKNSSMFKILFMGTFKNGKSTTINALLGGDLLPVGATATTAVISQVVYGEDTNTVKVFHEDGGTPEALSMNRFMEEYRLSDDDLVMIENEGGTDRFKDIDYVMLESNLELFKDGVQFIDSPGLGEAVARTKTTNKFIPQANAIVFLLDAMKLFSDEEKKFIKKHFVNVAQKPRNVFFLVNRINQLNSDADREAVKHQVQLMLKSVFTDDNGYNQALYNERVFFVNSYGALQMQKEGQVPVGTGIPEFKTALEKFLTSEDRVVAKYKSVMANMAGVYVSAERQIQENTSLLRQDVSVLEANRAAAESKLNELSKRVEGMEKSIERTRKNITNKVINSLETFVKVDLVNDWAAYAANCEEHFGILDMFKLALPFVSEDTKQDILAPMVEFVNKYVTGKLEDWGESVPLLIDSDISALQDDLEDQSVEFDLKLDQAKAIFSGADSSRWQGAGANKLQLALSLIQGDVSVAVENAAGGNFSWGDFFKRYVIQGVINIMIFSLIGGGVPGFIVSTVVEMIQLGINAHSVQSRILNGLAEGLFPKIGNELMKNGPK